MPLFHPPLAERDIINITNTSVYEFRWTYSRSVFCAALRLLELMQTRMLNDREEYSMSGRRRVSFVSNITSLSSTYCFLALIFWSSDKSDVADT